MFLIYGSKGWIGQQILKYLDSKNILYAEGKERSVNQTELLAEINEINPTHVISLIGRTHGRIDEKNYTTIDYLQDPSKISVNLRDNLYSPVALAIICEKMKIHFTYLGTGCLFEYDELHPYGNEETGFKDSDVPNFFGSNYSTVKGYADRLMHLFENTLNLRIRMCLTPEHNWRNFITKLVTYEKICSIPNSMTVLPDLIPAMIDMVLKKVTGTVNLTNPGLITHNEILEMYKELVDPAFTWKNMTLEEQTALLAAGRSNNYLDVSGLQQHCPYVKHIKVAVRDCMKEYKKL
jgi:3,5-epimerase/4-reductase